MFWFTLSFFSLVLNVVTEKIALRWVSSLKRLFWLVLTTEPKLGKIRFDQAQMLNTCIFSSKMHFLATAHLLLTWTAGRVFCTDTILDKIYFQILAQVHPMNPMHHNWESGQNFLWFFFLCTEMQLVLHTVINHKRIKKKISISAIIVMSTYSKYLSCHFCNWYSKSWWKMHVHLQRQWNPITKVNSNCNI